MSTSGTADFFLSNSDVVIEAFERCEMFPPAITGNHMLSARRSLNLELTSAWPNFVPLLWKIDEEPTQIPLQQGVATYNIPTDTVTMLDTYIRTFQLPSQFNVTPAFTTAIGSSTVTATVGNNGMLPGYWFQITTPVAIDGLVLYGFYQVIATLNSGSFTFAATGTGAAGASGGTLPLFTTVSTQTTVQVTLANHGYTVAGQTFNVAVATTVGGITLLGTYTITGITDANNFVIQTSMVASSSTSGTENNGQVQFQCQSQSVDPIDRILTPMGRTDYAELPDKFKQTIPTQYLFLRNINPTVTLYQVPDGNGPYVLSTYLMRRIQDANLGMGQAPDVHFLFLDALCARLAVRLAVKFGKKLLPVLKQEASEAWEAAITENRERVEIMLAPNLSSYYRL